jgi:hypothetical protein
MNPFKGVLLSEDATILFMEKTSLSFRDFIQGTYDVPG